MTPAGLQLKAAAKRLADARIGEAMTFLRLRINAKTDNAAKAMTVIEMNGEVEEAEAEYEIAKAALAREGK